MKKILAIGVLLLFAATSVAQKKINNYKYVIVPNKLEFLTKVDRYQTSSLTKFLFNKFNFKAYLNTDQLPKDFNENRCLALFADLEKTRSLFLTKINVVLKDCNNVLVFKSRLGKSREKEFKKAYNEAIRNAFQSIDSLHYVYQPVANKRKSLVTNPQVITFNNQKNTDKNAAEQLYAQAIDNGFQLIDKTPKVVFVLLKTSQPNLFLIQKKQGVLYKVGAVWVAEYYQDNQLVQKKVRIKF